MHIIKGCPRDKWDEVQAIQHEPFIYIMGNGSKWAGQEEDDVSELLRMLAAHPLDPTFEEYGNFIAVDPCQGVRNPKHCGWGGDTDGEPQWIDGPRLYACDGVHSYFGNFYTYSHGFNIDTNDPETIAQLNAAIRANQATEAYAQAKRECEASTKSRAQTLRRGR
jgi:hypothetical protein